MRSSCSARGATTSRANSATVARSASCSSDNRKSTAKVSHYAAPVRRFGDLLSEASKFGAVGVVNLALDISVFNLLRVAVVSEKPLTAKAISMSLAATSSYFMNRHWTWRDRARTGVRREYVLFMVLSAVGLGLTETCLAISHYVLGFHSVLADNIAANGVGLVVGMVWRFWSFRQWVFLPVEPVAEATADAAHNAPV